MSQVNCQTSAGANIGQAIYNDCEWLLTDLSVLTWVRRRLYFWSILSTTTRNLHYFLLIILAVSCQKSKDADTILPEYADWYVLKSPIDHPVDGIWGDIDKTLILTSGYTVFRSTDRGQNWQPVSRTSSGAVGAIQFRDTLFVFTGQRNQTVGGTSQSFWGNVQTFSVDDGKTWNPYRRYNPTFDSHPSVSPTPLLLLLNPVSTPTGLSYRINEVYRDGPTATVGPLETPGVLASGKRRIDLPNLHQLKSLYLDSQERLYISGSDAVCGRGRSYGEDFAFCNSRGGWGVVYISKKPRP